MPTKVLVTKQEALRQTILHAALQDGPGLFSAAAGTGIYVGHLPDMLKEDDKLASPAVPAGGAQLLLPRQLSPASRMPNYFSLSITATSPLQGGR